MILDIIILLSLILKIIIPSIFIPEIFLGVLLVYILARQYWLALIWLVVIIYFIQTFSLTPWWEFIIYYLLWGIGVYISSIFLDKGWAVQSIIATIWLFICKFIIVGLVADYLNIAIYAIINGIFIAVFLYFAEKLRIYEKFV